MPSGMKMLKFSVEYVGRYRNRESANEIDIQVEDIDIEELMESPARLEKIVDYIIAHHNKKRIIGSLQHVLRE
jgi:type I restriction enzyme, R subunit